MKCDPNDAEMASFCHKITNVYGNRWLIPISDKRDLPQLAQDKAKPKHFSNESIFTFGLIKPSGSLFSKILVVHLLLTANLTK